MSERYHLHHGVELIIEQEIIDLLRDHGVPDLAIEKLDTTISPRIALRYHASAPFSKKKELEVEAERMGKREDLNLYVRGFFCKTYKKKDPVLLFEGTFDGRSYYINVLGDPGMTAMALKKCANPGHFGKFYTFERLTIPCRPYIHISRAS